jgi:hypothetical protein
MEHEKKTHDGTRHSGIIHKEEVKVKEAIHNKHVEPVKEVKEVKDHKPELLVNNNPGHNKNHSISSIPVANTGNTGNTGNTNNQKQKEQPKLQSLLRDDAEPKKKDPILTVKMDPNSTDIKDMKIGVNMDAETAYKLYQDNKQYLPSKEQTFAAATKTADFVNQNSEVITGSKGNPEKKKGFFDPLTSLFGSSGPKKDSAQSSKPSNKGTF